MITHWRKQVYGPVSTTYRGPPLNRYPSTDITAVLHVAVNKFCPNGTVSKESRDSKLLARAGKHTR
jgi:hypothetical protein